MIQRASESIHFEAPLEKSGGSKPHKRIGIESVVTTKNHAL